MLNECNECEYQCNLSHIDICTLGSPCPHQRSTPMTEQEYLQTCTTEQLAEWIAKIVDCDCCPVKRKFCDDNPCKIRFAEWLKQPHHEKE